MKILYVTTISETMIFFVEHIKMLIKDGHSVELACNCHTEIPEPYKKMGCKVYDLSFSRSPFDKENITAYKKLKKIVEKGKYDVVHTHTPNASIFARLACRKPRRHQKTKVIYSAHGFHFYKGAPLKNWIMYYTAERICSLFTDVLITINKEDYELGKSKMKAGRIEYVPGVGIDLNKFKAGSAEKNVVRKKINVPADSKFLLSVGELNSNKNHETVIRAVSMMKNDKVRYAIAGSGELDDYLEKLIHELGVEDRVHLLGYRRDVADLYEAADIFVFPSFREGLSVSLMEAMSKGKPCAVSRIRGNVDLIDDKGGTLFDPHSIEDCKHAIEQLIDGPCEHMSEYNMQKIEGFSINNVIKIMRKVYYQQ